MARYNKFASAFLILDKWLVNVLNKYMATRKNTNKKNNQITAVTAVILLLLLLGVGITTGAVLQKTITESNAVTDQAALPGGINFPPGFPFNNNKNPNQNPNNPNNKGGVTAAQAVLKNAQGATVANVTLTSVGNAVRVQVSAKNLTSGFHGFHIHAVGMCNPPDFASAGAHFNPTEATHPNHAGDMPWLLAGQEGNATADFITDRFKIQDLFGTKGTSIIIHAGADNFANIPTRYTPPADATTLGTGDAGTRFACGVIKQVGKGNGNNGNGNNGDGGNYKTPTTTPAATVTPKQGN
jgi:superoxide dismutase, Cu-Zn family